MAPVLRIEVSFFINKSFEKVMFFRLVDRIFTGVNERLQEKFLNLGEVFRGVDFKDIN